MLFDVYEELKELISEYEELPKGTMVQIGETESRKSSISIVLTYDSSTRTEICGNVLWVYKCKIIYQIEAQTDNRKLKVFEFLENLYKYLDESKKEKISFLRGFNIPTLDVKNINGLDVFSIEFMVYV
jgi:hypothetical protein